VLQQRVLLIEDSEDAMLLVRYALHEYGQGKYSLVWATSLSEGLTELSKGGVDIVLLDLGLPESSGPESCAWIREMALDVPVVVLTGDACAETELLLTLASGARNYLIKGQISGSMLLQAIRSALCADNRRPRRQPIGIHKITQRFRWIPYP
jgi:DNA-binding response OmpR family regulator